MQLDNLRAVHLCAARCAPFVAHNRPARKLRLMAALDEKTPERRVYIDSIILLALALYVVRITEL